jgi:hypothetical protein
MKTLWTGRTARQEFVSALMARANATSETIGFALEVVLDGAENAPASSVKAGLLAWWNSASGDAQQRLLAEARRMVKGNDKLMGRKLAR